MMYNPQDLVDPILCLGEAAKKAGIAYSVAASLDVGFSVTASQGLSESSEYLKEQSMTLTVYDKTRTASVSSTDFSKQALLSLLEKATSMARLTEPDPCAGLPPSALMAEGYPDLDLSHAWELPIDQAFDRALSADRAALASHAFADQVEESCVTSFHGYRAFANSLGFVGHYPVSMHGHSVSVVARSNQAMERDFEYSYARDPQQLLTPELLGEIAAERAVKRLDAVQLATQKAPVLFDARVARSLIGHFIGAIAGTAIYRNSSFLADHLGEKIFPNFVTIGQQPHIQRGYNSRPFDAQGVVTTAIDYVSDGVLNHYVLGQYAANKLQMKTTGNAGGVFNLKVRATDVDLAALCRKMGTGLLVTELMGQGVDLLTGDYSRGAAGFWVENGVIAYPVEKVTVASNLKNMLASIIAIADDAHASANIQTGAILLEEMTIAGSSAVD